jgi:putative protein-disulfide isomerase
MNTLIAVFDPLCGWCYGFGPVLIRLQEKYADRMNFDVLSGGMITGSRIGPIAHMAGFIRQAIPVVEQHTGIAFGSAFLDKTLVEGTAIFSSLEPAKALTIFRQYFPKKVAVFSHEIQRLIYHEGINPVDVAAYLPLFAKYGLSKDIILPQFSSSVMEQETINEFGKAYRWKITGYPACVMQMADGKAFLISNGFTSFENMESAILPYLN